MIKLYTDYGKYFRKKNDERVKFDEVIHFFITETTDPVLAPLFRFFSKALISVSGNIRCLYFPRLKTSTDGKWIGNSSCPKMMHNYQSFLLFIVLTDKNVYCTHTAEICCTNNIYRSLLVRLSSLIYLINLIIFY